MHLVGSSFLFLVVRPGAPSSVLAPSSRARSPERSFLCLENVQLHPNVQVELKHLQPTPNDADCSIDSASNVSPLLQLGRVRSIVSLLPLMFNIHPFE